MERRGRPSGQFDYNKLCVLKGLQDAYRVISSGKPISLTNEELCKLLSPYLAVKPRTLAKYLLALQNDKNIEIYYHRVRSIFKRIIIVNYLDSVNV